jgi:hypothetical protein
MTIITGDGVYRDTDYEVPASTNTQGVNIFNNLSTAATPVVYKGHVTWRPKNTNGLMYMRMYDENDVQFQLRGLMRTSYQNTEISYSQSDSQTYMYLQRYFATTSTSFVPASITFTWICMRRNGKAYPVFLADCNWVYSSSYIMSSHVALIAHHPSSTTLMPRKITFWLQPLSGVTAYYGEGSSFSMWRHSELGTF